MTANVMNLPSLKRLIPASALAVIALVLCAMPFIKGPPQSIAFYNSCVRLVAGDPVKALAHAQAWRVKYPESVMAKHCEALAFFATHDYAHAGESFAALATQAAAGKPDLAVKLYLQSAQAYRKDLDYDAAGKSAGDALALKSADPRIKSLVSEISEEKSSSELSGLSPATGKIRH